MPKPPIVTRPRLTDEEADAIVATPRTPRWRALLLLLRRTGIRVSELTAITTGDVHPETSTIVIPRLKHRMRIRCPFCQFSLAGNDKFCGGCGKRVTQATRVLFHERRTREMPVDSETMKLLQDYIATLRGQPRTHRLFPFSRQWVSRMTRKPASRALGIPLKGERAKVIRAPGMKQPHYISTHHFRANFITALIEEEPNEVGVKRAQDLAGHAQPDTTRRSFRLLELSPRYVDELWKKRRLRRPAEGAPAGPASSSSPSSEAPPSTALSPRTLSAPSRQRSASSPSARGGRRPRRSSSATIRTPTEGSS